MNLLHLDSAITGDTSVSRQLSAEIVKKLTATNPSVKVTYRDLVANPLAHLTLDQFATPESAEIMAELKAADVIVIGAPMYNFNIASQLKAWIDRIAVAGQTFKYTETGPVGLLTGKRAIIAMSSGGFYGPQTPMAAFNHVSVYLTQQLGFLGITDIQIISAEGIAMGPDSKATAITQAETTISQLKL